MAVVQPLTITAQSATSVVLRGHTALLYVQAGRVVVQLGTAAADETLTAGETLRVDLEAASIVARVCTDAEPAQIILVDIALK